MRSFLLVALLALGLSACGDDDPTGSPGVHPDIRGTFVGLYNQLGTSPAGDTDFKCDMRVEVLDQFEMAFIADVYFLAGQDCAEERLWAEATSGTIDLDGNVTLTWDNSPACNTFSGDKALTGTLVGNVLSLAAEYVCDGISFDDTYTGSRG